MSFKSKAFNKFALIVCAAFATVPAVANAAVISVNSNLDGKTVDAGKSLNGMFNFGTQLIGQQVNSLTISASFQQDKNAQLLSEGTGTNFYESEDPFEYCCGLLGCKTGYNEYYGRNDIDTYYDAAATASLSVGSATRSVTNNSQANAYDSLDLTNTSSTTNIFDSLGLKKFLTVYSYDSTTGYSGNFTTSFALSAADITALTASNSLAFTVGALTNGFKINNISLTANTVAVPEPGSLLLLGLGFTGLLAARRRKLF